MVTFICEYCDKTLKKKQCEGHIRSCSPGSLICIDCGSVFHGNGYKTHITCISEQQKHWGQYAKPKKTKPIAKQEKPTVKNNSIAQKVEKQRKKSKQIVKSEEKVGEVCQSWRGWKNELKSLVKEKDGKMEKNALIEQIKNRYRKEVGQEMPSDEFIWDKVSKIKKLDCITYVVYKEE